MCENLWVSVSSPYELLVWGSYRVSVYQKVRCQRRNLLSTRRSSDVAERFTLADERFLEYIECLTGPGRRQRSSRRERDEVAHLWSTT